MGNSKEGDISGKRHPVNDSLAHRSVLQGELDKVAGIDFGKSLSHSSAIPPEFFIQASSERQGAAVVDKQKQPKPEKK